MQKSYGSVASVLVNCPMVQDGQSCLVLPFSDMSELTDHLVSGDHLYELSAGKAFPSIAMDAPLPSGSDGSQKRGPASTVDTTSAVLTTAEVDALCLSIGRKFGDADMTKGLQAFASAWLADYRGNFEFLTDLANQRRALSIPQLRGVLNCYRSDVLRRPTASNPATTATVEGVEAVRIVGDVYLATENRFVRVYRNQKTGNLYGKFRVSDGWDYDREAFASILPEQDPTVVAAAAASWGHEHDRCVFCATPLTDDGPARSVEIGYGPVCAVKYGLAWG